MPEIIEPPRFIVLLRHPGGMWLALSDEDGPLGFATEESARQAAKTNTLADAYGALIVDTDDCTEV